MKRNHALVATAAAALAAVTLVGGTVVRAEEKHSAHHATDEGSTLSMGRFYTGSDDAQVGNFPGKLVCLRCDLKPGPDMMSRCQKEGHRHALSMEADSMIHPLLAGTDKVLKQINSGELHDKDVTVHGRYYPSTGAILVDRISAAK